MPSAFLGVRFQRTGSLARTLELCLFLALACCTCSAAPYSDRTISQFAHTSWGPKDGAPRPVTALAQTSDGYLWLGGPSGLYRFDGISFEHYRPQPGTAFPYGTVSALLALPNGDLWIGFSNGTISLLRNGNLTTYTTRDGVPEEWVWTLAQDREGTIWAATDNGLARLEGKRWRRVGKDWNLPAKSAMAVFSDRQGTLWVSTENTLMFLPPGSRRFQPTDIRVGQVKQIAQAPSGKLWMAETTRSVRPIPLSDRRQPPDDTEVRVGSIGILFDNDGALWITTVGDGLRRAPAPELLKDRIGEFSTAVESFTAKDGLSHDFVYTILQDHEGTIWVGTNNGLDRFRKTSLVPVALPFKVPYVVLAAGDAGDIWIAHLNAMFRIHEGIADRGHPFPDQPASAYRAPGGAIWWICLSAIYRYEAGTYTKIALPSSFPKPFFYQGTPPQATEDGSGTFWLTAQRQGLFYLKKGAWHQLEIPPEFAKSSPAAAFTDGRGRAWFGYTGGKILVLEHESIQKVFPAKDSLVGSLQAINGRGNHLWVVGDLGLSYFDGDRFRRILPADAETFNSIFDVQEDSNGSLWLGRGKDVVEIPATEIQRVLGDPSYRVKYRVFGSFDGFPGLYAKIVQATDGKLWISASDGLVWVDPAHITTNAFPPLVLIRSVQANGKQFSSLKNLALPPRTTNLQISYTALSLSVPEKVRFRYKLQGVDNDWQDAGTRREAFYNGLGPGRYHFRVIACNNDGVWNEDGARLDFSIAPAWYQTIWFRLLCVVAFLAFLWGLHQLRVRHLHGEERKLREAIETIPAMAWVTGADGNIQFRNRRWVEFTGVSQVGKAEDLRKILVHPEDLDRLERRRAESRARGEPYEEELRIRRADGEYRWFLVRAVPLLDKRGKVVKWYGAATDIEDRKRAEQLQADLTHASRLSTMGELVASISHELAQPITATTNNAKASLRWLEHNPPDLSQVRKGTESIIEAGTFASEIIDRLRSLYKKSSPKRELVAINEVIGEMARLMGGKAREDGVSIRTDLADKLPLTMTDRVQLQQVLMNLMLNGIEAMKDTGGILTVRSRLAEDGMIEISVNDMGPGLPPGAAGQIFDAFFTTKPRGSGMGLAISKSIVESLSGRIWASNDAGRGATFYFTLPAAPAN